MCAFTLQAFALAYRVKRLRQQTVEMLADEAYEYALAARLAFDGLVFFRRLVALVELGDREPAQADTGIHLLLGEGDLGPLIRPEYAACMLLDGALGVLLDLIGRAAQLVIADIENFAFAREQRHDLVDDEATALAASGGDRCQVLVRMGADHAC